MRLAHTVISLMLIAPLSWAGNMTFQFRNPNFGGNPNNGAFMLTVRRLKIPIKTPAMTMISVSRTPSALDNFTQAIQSQILGGLLTNINTGKPGRMVTNDFIVDIANKDGQLQLNVTDRKPVRRRQSVFPVCRPVQLISKQPRNKDNYHAALFYFSCSVLIKRLFNRPAKRSR